MIVRLSRTMVHGLVGIGLLAVTGAAYAVDGTIEINAASATAGGVTSGDTAGYPVTISESGTYRLTGNLMVPDGNTTAIQITASNVTLDLNGFTIRCQAGGATPCGPSSPGATGDGVKSTSSSVTNVVVRNGTIANMGHYGINLYGARVEDVRAIANGLDGFNVNSPSNPGNSVVRSTAMQNGRDGVRCANDCEVTDSVMLGNGGDGISVTDGALITGNTISSNAGRGINAVNGGMINSNVINNNALYGIRITGTGTGYQYNVLTSNYGANPEVTGGNNMGNNLICDGGSC